MINFAFCRPHPLSTHAQVFPPKGKRVLGNMSGAYTMCKGNMGQHNFSVKVGKFNLIVPESALAE